MSVSTHERSQYANKRIASKRLFEKIQIENQAKQKLGRVQRRDGRLQLDRGCPVVFIRDWGFNG